jgi:hypothetical protein
VWARKQRCKSHFYSGDEEKNWSHGGHGGSEKGIGQKTPLPRTKKKGRRVQLERSHGEGRNISSALRALRVLRATDSSLHCRCAIHSGWHELAISGIVMVPLVGVASRHAGAIPATGDRPLREVGAITPVPYGSTRGRSNFQGP